MKEKIGAVLIIVLAIIAGVAIVTIVSANSLSANESYVEETRYSMILE